MMDIKIGVIEMTNKIVFRVEVEENDFGGITWTPSVLGKKGNISDEFKNRIYEDLNIDVESCDVHNPQEILD